MAPRRAVYGLWLGLRGGGQPREGTGTRGNTHAHAQPTEGPGPKATTTKGETKRRPEEGGGEYECTYIPIYKLEGEREKGGREGRGEEGKACPKKGARGLYKGKTSQAQGRERERKEEAQARKEKQREGSQANERKPRERKRSNKRKPSKGKKGKAKKAKGSEQREEERKGTRCVCSLTR